MNLIKIFRALLLILITTLFSFAQVSSRDNQAFNAEFSRLLVDQQVPESKTVEKPTSL